MKTTRTLSLVAGGMVAGGALVYALSKLLKPIDVPARPDGEPRSLPHADGSDVLLVLVTENGRKYHRETCPLLRGETRLIPVSYALESYEPCKACHPPGGVDLTQEDLAEAGLDAEDID